MSVTGPFILGSSCHYTANCLYSHDSYITKFDFMNYAFAKLVLAWLYISASSAYLTDIARNFWISLSLEKRNNNISIVKVFFWASDTTL